MSVLTSADLLNWETAAVALAIAYLLLAVRENILCWYCALLSSGLFIFLFWDVSLLMESALNVYYVFMAAYGWYQWKFGGTRHSGVRIHRLAMRTNILIITVVLALSAASGYLLAGHSSAAWPYLDSFTTWGSVITTVLVARKVLENWLYWLVIDSVSIVLYIDRGLYATAILFMAYIVIVIFGFFNWRQRFNTQQAATVHAN